MKNKQLFTITLLILTAGCSSSLKKLDAGIESKGSTTDATIGIKDNKVVIQRETSAQDELRSTQWWNNKYEDDLKHEYFMLKWCREDVADPRLSGSGEVTPLPEIDNMKQASDVKEEFGLTEKGNLSFVTQEDFLKRIQIERNYQTTLMKMVKTVTTQREDCERKMGQARTKIGLPANRYQGQSTITPEGTIGKVIRLHENSLDDAFKILEMEKSKRSPASEDSE